MRWYELIQAIWVLQLAEMLVRGCIPFYPSVLQHVECAIDVAHASWVELCKCDPDRCLISALSNLFLSRTVVCDSVLSSARMKHGTPIPVKLQQRFNVFFAQRMGVSMAVTVKAIQYVYGWNSLSPTQIWHWFWQFQSGRNRVLDLPRKAKENTGRTPQNINKVKELIDQDNRQSISTLSFLTGIPWSMCRKILRWDLKLCKKSAKFVPHLLTEAQMYERFRISSMMLAKIKEEPSFLETVVTMDESWVYSYDPELKCQSNAWLRKGEARPLKVAHPRTVGKVLLVFFWLPRYAALGICARNTEDWQIHRHPQPPTSCHLQKKGTEIPAVLHPSHG